ncbi:MAG TPA: hypothetical protein VJA46_05875 [Acidimicrobiia bacterium]|nr:hypothetical protein [Acidimicrobiia bacterium]
MIGDANTATLPKDHWAALKTSVDGLIDEFSEDIAGLLLDEVAFEHTFMSSYVPPQFTSRYTALFAKKMLVCLVTVGWKLEHPGQWPLACTGEQLALRALIERAESQMELDGQAFDFGDFVELAFQDTDLDMLFDPAWDGIEDSDIADHLGARHLHPDRWFEPFYEGIPVPPYGSEGT